MLDLLEHSNCDLIRFMVSGIAYCKFEILAISLEIACSRPLLGNFVSHIPINDVTHRPNPERHLLT